MAHSMIGMSVEQAIRLVVFGNQGKLIVIDKATKKKTEHGKYGDFVCKVLVRDNKVVKVGRIS